MKKVFGFIAMALALVACNKNEMYVQPEGKVQEGTITITAQLAPKGEITKAVSDQGTSIKVDWAVDEHIAILYSKDGNKKADARITAVDGTGKATIEFDVVAGTADDTDCTIVYPYAAAKDDNSGAKTYSEFLSAQNGTLNANLDIRIGAGKIQVTTPGLDVTTQPAAQYAIFKFTTSITANGFVVRDGSDALITNVTPASPTNSFYVAIPAKTSGTAFKFIASDGTKIYTKSISTTAAIEAGTYYQTPLDMGAGETITSVDLATVTTNRTFGDFVTLTGTLDVEHYPVKISIADGSTVTLDGVIIDGDDDGASDAASSSVAWAGITCEGDATIILSGANAVKGFYYDYPGIYVPVGKTLTIQGTGSLNASSNGFGAGIGGGSEIACGNIEIQGGTITVTSGDSAAGIGGGYLSTCGNITISGGTIVNIADDGSGAGIGSGDDGTCGDITISGGTVTATGGIGAAGIGGGCGEGYPSECGNITILNTVTQVTATKGSGATNSIGAGLNGSCGTVTIDGVEGAITESPYTYIPGALSGKFSVSSTKQVYFSQGNLKYSNGTWSFHENQYDMCFTSNGDVSGNYDLYGTFDLFGWGTSGYNHGANAFLPYSTSTTYSDYYAYGVSGRNLYDMNGTADWGYNAISNGGDAENQWRTLTKAEWKYVFSTRTVNGGTGSGKSYTKGQSINGVLGIVLYPDDYTGSEYSGSDWATFEAAGCVFLPAAGNRNGTTVGLVGSIGYYWSSSDASDVSPVNSYHVYFNSGNLASNAYNNRNYGFSVRLVKDAN